MAKNELHPKRLLRLVASMLATLIFGAVILFFAIQVGPRSMAFAFWINWFLMLWAHLLMTWTPIRFPADYYVPRAFEQPLYRWLQVPLAQKALRRLPHATFAKAQHESTITHRLRYLERTMMEAETAHMLIWLIIGVIQVYAMARGWWEAAAWLFLWNMLLNGYPVMVQRYNRMRIRQLQRRLRRVQPARA